MSKADSILRLMKRRLKIILVLSLTMIACLMGIIFSGMNLNKEYQNFSIEMRNHLHYSKKMTNIAIDLNTLQYDQSLVNNRQLDKEIISTRTRLIQLLGQVDKEIHLLSQRNQDVEAFQISIAELKRLWQPFRESILTVVDGDVSDRRLAIKYIEDNYDDIYYISDQIAQQATELAKKRDTIRIYISGGLMLIAFTAIIVQFAYIFGQVILPLEEVYNEIKMVGVSKTTLDIKRSKKNKNVYPIIEEINYKLKKLGWLISTIQNINNNDNFNDILQYMYSSFSAFLPLNHIGIALIGDDDIVSLAYSIADDSMRSISDQLLSTKVHINDTSLHGILDSGKPRVINNLEGYVNSKTQSYYNRILLDSGVRSSITIPLKINNSAFGFVFFSSNQRDAYNEEHAQFLEVLADSIAISFNKNILINEILYGNSLALAKLAESRDNYTGEHLTRIKTYSWMIAKFLSVGSKYKDTMDYQFIQDIEKYSELHDIGKVAIEDGILLKPGKLTQEEFEIMKKHTIYGGRVLREADASIKKGQNKIFRMGIEIAECHHEKWNGCGYPFGLKGEMIPISARIVAVADVFDALTSVRPYKKAMDFEESFAIIEDGKGESFDPEIIDVMVKYKMAFRDALEVFKKQSDC